MTRVLITRPEPGATRTLNVLRARGIDAVSLPLTEIQPLNFSLAETGTDMLVVTSQNAISHGAALLAQYRAKPIFAVGRRTAEMLQGLGHLKVEWVETVQQLLPLIIRHNPKTALYVCGQTRRPELEIGLAKANIQCQAIEVYSASRTLNVKEKLLASLAGSPDPIILFYAPSAAEIFRASVQAQHLPALARFLCISAAIIAQLPQQWHAAAILADQPDDAAMINQLDKMLA